MKLIKLSQGELRVGAGDGGGSFFLKKKSGRHIITHKLEVKKAIIRDCYYFSGGRDIKSNKKCQNSYFFEFLCQLQFYKQLYYWLCRYIFTRVLLYCQFPGEWNLTKYMNVASYNLEGNHTCQYELEVFSDFPKVLIVFISFYILQHKLST